MSNKEIKTLSPDNVQFLIQEMAKKTTSEVDKVVNNLGKQALVDRHSNILDVSMIEVTNGNYTLSHNEDDSFSFTIAENSDASTYKWSGLSFPLNKPLPLKKGDIFTFNLEILEGKNSYVFSYYIDSLSMPISSAGKFKKISPTIISCTQIADKDYYLNTDTVLKFATGAKVDGNYYPKFRVWITKGDEYIPYSSPRGDVPGFVLHDTIVDKQLEDKVNLLDDKLSRLDGLDQFNIDLKKQRKIFYYETMPPDKEIAKMPKGTVFHTLGYYDILDGCGSYYYVDNVWVKCGKIIKNDAGNVVRYLIPLNDDGSLVYSKINLAKYGIRPCRISIGSKINVTKDDGTVVEETITELTPENTHARLNSNILENIVDGAPSIAGFTYYIPKGNYYFEKPIDIYANTKSLCGDSMTIFFNGGLTRNDYSTGTVLYFPFLKNGEAAINTGNGSVDNLCICGVCDNPDGSTLNYDFHIDRTKTITNPDEVVEEKIKTVIDEKTGEEVEYKTIGINGKGSGFIRNVFIVGFYNGIVIPTANNKYLNTVYFKKCHFGLTTANDVKCVGLYGWDVHTPLKVTGSIVSVVQLRVDSCVNVINMTGTVSAATIVDVDGDYCTDSLILVGDHKNGYAEVCNCVFDGIHGRCCTLKSFDEKKSTYTSAKDLTISDHGYGIIHVGGNASFHDNQILINSLFGNPFDTKSEYKTSPIIFTYGGSDGNEGINLRNNVFTINHNKFTDDENFIKSVIQMGHPKFSCKINTANNTFYINKDVITSLSVENINKLTSLINFLSTAPGNLILTTDGEGGIGAVPASNS